MLDDFCAIALYLIEILHQTTTLQKLLRKQAGCILSKFYIKPQLCGTRGTRKCGCILSKFYIKPQHMDRQNRSRDSCILSKFYIKPQLQRRRRTRLHVVSYRNSTSNHNCFSWIDFHPVVVSYRNSTSNHNSMNFAPAGNGVVSYRNSTSNHNVGPHID